MIIFFMNPKQLYKAVHSCGVYVDFPILIKVDKFKFSELCLLFGSPFHLNRILENRHPNEQYPQSDAHRFHGRNYT